MNENEFLSRLKQILNTTDVMLNSQLDTLEEWDSLATVNFMGLFTLEGKEMMDLLQKAETVGDLYKIVNGQIEE